MAQYDATVLQEYADSLYRNAAWVAAKCGALGAGIGVAVELVLANFIIPQSFDTSNGMMGIIAFALLGALIGIAIGQRRSFEYRLQAQTVLCQMQIEQNTRQSKA